MEVKIGARLRRSKRLGGVQHVVFTENGVDKPDKVAFSGETVRSIFDDYCERLLRDKVMLPSAAPLVERLEALLEAAADYRAMIELRTVIDKWVSDGSLADAGMLDEMFTAYAAAHPDKVFDIGEDLPEEVPKIISTHGPLQQAGLRRMGSSPGSTEVGGAVDAAALAALAVLPPRGDRSAARTSQVVRGIPSADDGNEDLHELGEEDIKELGKNPSIGVGSGGEQ